MPKYEHLRLIVALVVVLAIVVVQFLALSYGYNGTVLKTTLLTLGAVAGYVGRDFKQRG